MLLGNSNPKDECIGTSKPDGTTTQKNCDHLEDSCFHSD